MSRQRNPRPPQLSERSPDTHAVVRVNLVKVVELTVDHLGRQLHDRAGDSMRESLSLAFVEEAVEPGDFVVARRATSMDYGGCRVGTRYFTVFHAVVVWSELWHGVFSRC